MTFETQIKIPFRQADPAQIMFFANIFDISHDVFEEFIQKAGFSWDEWFKPSSWHCPIRHCECNYLAPLAPGKTYTVQVKILKLGESSFTVGYEYLSSAGSHAQVKMVHTFVDHKSFAKISIPELVRNRFSKFL